MQQTPEVGTVGSGEGFSATGPLASALGSETQVDDAQQLRSQIGVAQQLTTAIPSAPAAPPSTQGIRDAAETPVNPATLRHGSVSGSPSTQA